MVPTASSVDPPTAKELSVVGSPVLQRSEIRTSVSALMEDQMLCISRTTNGRLRNNGRVHLMARRNDPDPSPLPISPQSLPTAVRLPKPMSQILFLCGTLAVSVQVRVVAKRNYAVQSASATTRISALSPVSRIFDIVTSPAAIISTEFSNNESPRGLYKGYKLT